MKEVSFIELCLKVLISTALQMHYKNSLKYHKGIGEKMFTKYLSADGCFVKTVILLTVTITTMLGTEDERIVQSYANHVTRRKVSKTTIRVLFQNLYISSFKRRNSSALSKFLIFLNFRYFEHSLFLIKCLVFQLTVFTILTIDVKSFLLVVRNVKIN